MQSAPSGLGLRRCRRRNHLLLQPMLGAVAGAESAARKSFSRHAAPAARPAIRRQRDLPLWSERNASIAFIAPAVLRQAAKARGVEVVFQPDGMSLRESNSTSYDKGRDVRHCVRVCLTIVSPSCPRSRLRSLAAEQAPAASEAHLAHRVGIRRRLPAARVSCPRDRPTAVRAILEPL